MSEETDHSGVTERVRPGRQVSAGSVGRTTKVTPSNTAAAPPRGPADERPSLSVSVVCHGRRAERSRTERSHKQEPPLFPQSSGLRPSGQDKR